MNCAKCQTAMVAGFIPDQFDKLVAAMPRWLAGTAEKSFWKGVGARHEGRDDEPRGEPIPIRTYRCPACGYLESYARPEFEPA